MDEVKSGIELCNDFFNQVVERQDIDPKVAVLIRDLYAKKQLTVEKIRKSLKALRQEPR